MRVNPGTRLPALVIAFGCICTPLAGESISVAFLGNSHTYFNDLPGLVQSLADAGGDTAIVASSTPGGCSFSYPPNAHLLTPSSIALLEAGGWDYVVLQEQSQIPCIPYLRDSFMYPGAMALDSIAHAHTPCAGTVFYMTWGHNHHGPWVETFDGYSSPEFADFDAMQDSVSAAYVRLADSLGTPVAPVGVAWQNAYHGGVPLDVMFNADQYHPALAGSYLAACVFYATLFQKSPLGLSFNAGLDQDLVEALQAVADSTVMPRLEAWNIDSAMPHAAFEFAWGVPPRAGYSPMQDDHLVAGIAQTDPGGDTPTADPTEGTCLESFTLTHPSRAVGPCR